MMKKEIREIAEQILTETIGWKPTLPDGQWDDVDIDHVANLIAKKLVRVDNTNNGAFEGSLDFSLAKAISVAATAHFKQKRSNGTPYIFHPLRVMMGASGPTERIVAILHDVVEDTSVSLDDLFEQFGATVGDAVDALTRRGGEAYEDMIDRVKETPLARAVEILDIHDNLSDLQYSAFSPEKKALLFARYTDALAKLEEWE